MSIDEYNGGAIVAMKGKNCIALAADRRLGVQMKTIATNFQKCFKMQDNIFMGLGGLGTDIQTFSALMEYKLNLFNLRENRKMKPTAYVSLVSSTLYEHRWGPYFVSPIVVGLEDGKPILATYDSIGCTTDSENFAVGGTAGEFLYGLCESYYKPDLPAEELTEIIGQIITSGADRDALAGWGAVTYVITPDNINIRVLKTKQT